MNKRNAENLTRAALGDLDPAPATALTHAESERADELFARIVATPTNVQVTEKSERRRLRRRLALVGLVGAAGVAIPGLLFGGGSAFASWTPKPEPLTAAAATEAATTCRTMLGMRDPAVRVVIAERRGGWTYVVMGGSQADKACLMTDDLVGNPDPADNRDAGFFGSTGTDPADAQILARTEIEETQSMSGSVSAPGFWPFTTDEGWVSWVQGYVGSDVTSVTVNPPVGPDVEASIANGRFAAWWPSEVPSSKNLQVMGAWSYTVTLADGSTRTAP